MYIQARGSPCLVIRHSLSWSIVLSEERCSLMVEEFSSCMLSRLRWTGATPALRVSDPTVARTQTSVRIGHVRH
jgi:hypothetical protein